MKNKHLSLFLMIFPILLSGFNQTSAQSYSWSQLNDFGGSVRFGVFTFVIDNYGYMGGGYANGVSVDDVWQFNPTTNTWTQKSDCPLPVRACGNFAIDGIGYVVCGLMGGSTILDNVFAYDPVANTWIPKSDFPGVAIYGGASFAIDGKGYYGVGNGGGANGPYYTAFYEYTPTTDIWNQKAAFPGSPRYGCFGLAINDKGYVGFGGDDGPNLLYSDWYQYDPVTNLWMQKAFFPGAGRSYPCGFVLNNSGYIISGNSGAPVLDSDVYNYNPVANVWTVLPDFAGIARWAANGFSIGDTGYVGTGSDGTNYLRDFWKYAPDSSTNLNELSQMDEISIYPNPCLHILTLKSDNLSKFNNIEILTIEGKSILLIQLNKRNLESYQIDLSSIKQGVYFVKVNSGDRSVLKKFLKI